MPQITRRSDWCQRCYQRGDSRTFFRCHSNLKAIHRNETKHDGSLVPCHGLQDRQERSRHRKQAAMKVLNSVAMITGAAATAAGAAAAAMLTVTLPNPFTAYLTIAFAGSAAACAAGVTEASLYGKGDVINTPAPPFRCAITNRKIEIKASIPSHLSEIATRGVCLDCKGNVATTSPCRLLWTCCGEVLENCTGNPASLTYGLGTPCKTACGNKCKSISNGCIGRCIQCRWVTDEKDFSSRGCSNNPHDLVRLDDPGDRCSASATASIDNDDDDDDDDDDDSES
jgi:hypothetical protein